MSKTSDYFLFLDSSQRNTSSYPNVNNFVLQLNETFQDITQIELTNAVLPYAGGNLYTQGLLFIRLIPQEFNRISTSLNSSLSYTAFPLTFTPNVTGATSFVVPNPASLRNPVSFGANNFRSISRRMGVAFYKADGSLFNFGESAGDITAANAVKLVFKITCKNVDENSIGFTVN